MINFSLLFHRAFGTLFTPGGYRSIPLSSTNIRRGRANEKKQNFIMNDSSLMNTKEHQSID
jgi:hypothetical protein